ncbi:MAG TPA: hypothetical protein VGA40_10170 [Candidatus Acidoferrales bacterium]
MKNRIATCAILLLAAAVAAPAQVWDKKEHTKWSKNDCQRILENSPWATKFTLTETRQEAFVADSSYGTGRESQPRVDFTAQLRSAMPVRLAVVRQLQIESKYDKMTDEQKRNFDQRAQQYLGIEFNDRIVVQVQLSSNVQIYQRQLITMWQGINEGAVPANMYIITGSGQRLPPLHFIAPTHGNPVMEVVFPRRTREGDLIDGDDKEFALEMPGIALSGDTSEPIVRFTFKPSKMKYKGEFVY